ncbi:MAG: hypothetical protein HZA48_02000 [Planctomycetes bacterium]|nr:hypothetical protein [Planctomycetota bacterium]
MKFYALLFLIMVFFMGICCDTGSSHQDMRGWFKWSTGRDLPFGAKIIGGKCLTTAIVFLDTYYIKFEAPNDFTKFLNNEFNAVNKDTAMSFFDVGKEWLKDMPCWNYNDVKDDSFFEKVFTDKDGIKFVSYVAFDSKTGVVHFVGCQCKD